jgi:hypothetical protein
VCISFGESGPDVVAKQVDGSAFANYGFVNVKAASGCKLGDDDLSVAVVEGEAAGGRRW